jgi:ABC-type multidrug transport system fused ATPase/permease subunit
MKICFDKVSLQYGSSQILRDISFSLEPGVQLALVGSSGAGKSSLARLLMRTTDPTTGTILIDKRPYQDYELQTVLRHIGVVLQKTEMISGTVRENITFAIHPEDLSTVTDDAIWEILDAISPTFRHRFNDGGLDTLVGKQGMQLSGGEQQRLCVARALLKKPEVLIVDEATASLDSETEQIVQRGIDMALASNIAALVVAHRFSTLRNCNRFVVLKRLTDCRDDESQVEIICNSAREAYRDSPTFRKLADLQGFRP